VSDAAQPARAPRAGPPAASSKRGPRETLRAVLLFTTAVILGIWATAWYLAAQDRHDVLRDARAELLGAQKTIAAQVGRTFEGAQSLLYAVDIWLGSGDADRERRSLRTLSSIVSGLQRQREFPVIVRLFNDHGDMIAFDDTPAEAINVADREYIRALDGRPDGSVHIGGQILDRNSGFPAIPVAMKARANAFGIAYIVTAIPVAPLAEAFAGLLITAPGVIGIVRDDGVFLFRSPDAEGFTGQRYEIERLTADYADRFPIGLVEGLPGPAGHPLMTAFARLSLQPLFVYATFRIADLDRKIHDRVQAKIAIGILATLAAIACAAWLAYLVRARDEETRRVARALGAAEEANHVKTQFLANVSHELRTPLNAIIGFSEMMATQLFGPLTDRYRGYAGDIQTSGRHLLSVVDQLLDMSSIEARRERLRPEPVDMRELVEQVALMLRVAADERGIALNVMPPHPQPLNSDARALRQILLNLMSNAIRFCRPGGAVSIAWTHDPQGGITLTVEDEGDGIQAHDLPRIFDLFWQGGSVYARRHGGVGLGLPLTRNLVEALGGTISVESQPGIGTRFLVRIPGSLAV